jgi:hypothetical protein
MAYSYIEYVGDGSTDSFSIPFPYMDSAEVSVFVDGVEDTGATFLSSGLIQTSSTPATGTVVRVSRSTNITSRAVDFSSGSVLTEEDLDQSNIQVFYAAQEAIDTAGESIFKTADGKFDAQSRVIKNVADPVNANDAVNKDWAETGMSSQLNQATAQATSASSSASTATTQAGIATTQAGIATTKASEASASASNALASENAAETSENNAASSASTATTQANTATTKASEASASATSASNSATTATTQANVATSAASTATAQATSATNSANSASSSATTATTKAGEASTSATSASQSAAEAQAYRDTTLGYRDSASASATSALSSKNAAATSETNAANSASSASTSASAAAVSATSAAQSAASAATLLDNFDDRYLGPKSADPSVDNDGDPLVIGALYFNTTDGVMKTYTASGWLAASSASVATMQKYNFTATEGQTAFTGSDDNTETLSITVGSEIVTLNGIVLESGTDYTPASGSITLATGASAGDELNVFAFGNFQVADTVSASAGGTFQNDVTVNGTVTADGVKASTNLTLEADFENDTSAGYSKIQFKNDGVLRGEFLAGGDFQLYEDTGTTGKFYWDASAESLGIGGTTTGSTLYVKPDALNTNQLKFASTGNSTADYTYGSSGSYMSYYQRQDGSTYNRHLDIVNVGDSSWGGVIKFLSNPNGSINAVERMRIDSSGNVGINAVPSGDGTLEIRPTSNIPQLKLTQSNVGGGGDGWKLHADGPTGGQLKVIRELSGSDTEAMRIDSAGRVTMPYQPAFRAVNTTPLTIDSGGGTYKIPYSYTVTNIGGHYNSSQARFTAPVDGFYYFSADVCVSGGNMTTYNYLFIRFHVNGIDISQERMMPRPSGGAYATVQVNMGIYLNAGDYIEPFIRQSAGSVVNVRTDQRSFSGYLVG